jgi:LmbE family N-acetylglucosaminyl deacetylase
MQALSRRKLLKTAACWTTLASFRNPLVREVYASDVPEPRKLKVMVTGGHPGDPEYGCGGTIARYAKAGHEVVILYLNRGEAAAPAQKPINPQRPDRVAEAGKACEILRARPLFVGQFDGKAIVDQAHYEEFRKIYSAERPDVVFAHWPIDNHRDHRATSLLTFDSWLRTGKKAAFYYYEVSNGEDTQMFSPTHYVDITATMEQKRAACYAHASQSPDRFYALQQQVARFRGIERGYTEAESFIRHVQSPANLLPDEI